VSIVYGFPNEKALLGHKKLECIELFTLNVLIRPVNFKKVSQKMVSNRFLGRLLGRAGELTFKVFCRPKRSLLDDDVTIRTLKHFDSRFDDFWENRKKEHGIILKRDSRYLNWRYNECPIKHYNTYVAERNEEIMAWIVVRTMDKFGLRNGAIVDIMAQPACEDILCSMLYKIEEDFVKEGVDLIAVSVPKWSGYYDVFKKSGFMACPKKLNPKKEPFIIYLLSKSMGSEFIRDPSNWYITWGDTDVV
jgi:hypothetical protein